ncbi:catalytic subunit of DNA polymerase zeta [Chloropicon primus]|uniref:DNA polymerase n=2 Tax=Chloropicon primus TaxID=1764295 RepID=A0A5B8MMW1_9CHLO|nr:catalytic subunit of DNA polymerase zeta [Chloropicon primus]UPR01218.1 catalytic subunit of DNA polymerase zeta [Chloropicon primus]|eukprot:QDZ21998.1 catalytic subunit of DNA polymerase zeta [Chloropicon primus]
MDERPCSTTPTPKHDFRVSIKQIDYYTTKPAPDLDICYSPFTGQEVRVAPVVRVFGSTPAGQTVCLHLHKILPYLYVSYKASPTTSASEHGIYLRKLAHSIDAALHLSQHAHKKADSGASSLKARFVHTCTLVRALPFYGYHQNEEFFAKIYVYDPKDLGKVANALLSGAVMGQAFQPFEAHVPYLLKFKTDYNLHGMEYINLSEVLLREPLPEDEGEGGRQRFPCSESLVEPYPVWTRDNVPRQWLCQKGGSLGAKEAHCDIEADAFGDYVRNPRSVPAISLQEADSDIQMVPSLAPIWAEERQRSRKMGVPFPPKAAASPARNEDFLHRKFRQKFRGAVEENLSQRKDSAPGAQGSQDPDAELSLKLTQAANEVKSPDRVRWEGLSPTSQSHLTTQDADDVLLETLHWMQESNDARAIGGDEIWNGNIGVHERPEGDLEEYMNSSQKECDDIVHSTLQSAEAAGASSPGGWHGLDENFASTTGTRSGAEARSESDDFEPLHLELTVEGSSRSDSDERVEDRLEDALEMQGRAASEEEPSSSLMAFRPITSAPSYADVKSSMRRLELPDVVYTEPFFSDSRDVPKRPTCSAGLEFKLKSASSLDLQGFSCNTRSGSEYLEMLAPRVGGERGGDRLFLLASKKLPPSCEEVNSWLAKRKGRGGSKNVHLPEMDFRMDPNTGQFIDKNDQGELHSLENTQRQSASFVATPSDHLEARPASPKYDEQVPFHLTGSHFYDDDDDDVTAENVESNTPGKQRAESLEMQDLSSGMGDQSGAYGPVGRSARRESARSDATAPGNGVSQITPPSPFKEEGKGNTPSSQAGYTFKHLDETETLHACPKVLSIEIFAENRGTKLPDPKYDAVKAIALVYEKQKSCSGSGAGNVLNLLVSAEASLKTFLCSMKRKHALSEDTEYFVVESEVDLIKMAAGKIVRADPDIVMGYEIQSESVGYLCDRLSLLQPGESFLRLISRSPSIPSNSELLSDEYGQLHASGLHSAGRIVLNLWRILRSELKLSIYSFHNCVHALTRRRVPHFLPAQLTTWYQRESSRHRCLEHLVLRSVLNLEMIECLDLVSRTCELAKVYGIDFFSVLTRGSQYRVESLLLRLAHTQNYILISPSKSQVANQSAMECLPLVMEPESRFYTSPVLVLDFQSLYPSMVMAYNLCYSTLAGHVESSDLAQSLGILSRYSSSALLEGDVPVDELIFSPNGSLFASANVRKGVLPRMLQEILDTRQMLKKTMKGLSSRQKALYRLLNSRQFALKLLANVTYGYTAAGFSGRMPCSQLADAIVQFGRVTMENAIKVVESNPKWQAKVVYGDSVSGRTPLLLKHDGNIVVKRICDLKLDAHVPTYTWTERGWTKIENIVCHRLRPDKQMLRIFTHTGMVDCTSDHSLVHADGHAMFPSTIVCGETPLMQSFPNEWSSKHQVVDVTCIREFVCNGKTYSSGVECAKCLGLPRQPSGAWTMKTKKCVVTADFARLMGFFMGAGSCGSCGVRSTWQLNNANYTTLLDYQSILEKIFPEFGWTIIDTMASSSVYKLVPYKSQYGSVVHFISAWRKLAYCEKNKVVPSVILNSPQEVRSSFLRGLHDADGTKRSKLPEVSQKSQIAAHSICTLMRSLGYTVVVDGRKDKPNVFRLRCRTKIRKQLNIVKRVIELPHEEYVYDLTTENHHFHAGIGNIVVHNTDSIFVHLPGRSREEAFRIGDEIATAVTSVNPSPVFLKFEKVYHPCVLVTKKRYVGYAYESRDQSKPVFDAKGIETIRRDSCPAVAKLLERSLRTLFETADLSLVKKYLLKQWEKIFKSRVSVQDFVFAKEVRLGTYSAKASVVPPAAIVAAKAMALDPRAEPKYAERIPYVVVHGEPGARLVDMVVSPGTLVGSSAALRLHETYYITKQILPALERCFSLLGADVKAWFAQMPKPNRWQPTKRPISALGLSGFSNESLGYSHEAGTRRTIDHFYLSKHCAVCDEMTATDQPICDKCCGSPQATALALQARSATLERHLMRLNSICSHCGGGDLRGAIACSSLACGVYYLRQKNASQHSASVILMLSSDEFF